jgi:hypothetical protein
LFISANGIFFETGYTGAGGNIKRRLLSTFKVMTASTGYHCAIVAAQIMRRKNAVQVFVFDKTGTEMTISRNSSYRKAIPIANPFFLTKSLDKKTNFVYSAKDADKAQFLL